MILMHIQNIIMKRQISFRRMSMGKCFDLWWVLPFLYRERNNYSHIICHTHTHTHTGSLTYTLWELQSERSLPSSRLSRLSLNYSHHPVLSAATSTRSERKLLTNWKWDRSEKGTCANVEISLCTLWFSVCVHAKSCKKTCRQGVQSCQCMNR